MVVFKYKLKLHLWQYIQSNGYACFHDGMVQEVSNIQNPRCIPDWRKLCCGFEEIKSGGHCLYFRMFGVEMAEEDMFPNKIMIGVCVMEKKAISAPMLQILERRLEAFGEFQIVHFGDKVILQEPIERKCSHVSNQFQNMIDLTVEIHGDAGSFEECFDQFTAKEWLHGDNMYKCDGIKVFFCCNNFQHLAGDFLGGLKAETKNFCYLISPVFA